ncbi:MAG: hypothetical protein OXI25_03005 [Chloroflexota bacterium]|nr:hypothetical protein [Chloroflexota bacterium]
MGKPDVEILSDDAQHPTYVISFIGILSMALVELSQHPNGEQVKDHLLQRVHALAQEVRPEVDGKDLLKIRDLAARFCKVVTMHTGSSG